MYSAMLLIHSWLRWAVLVAGVIAAARGLAGWSGRNRWSPADDRAGLVFVLLLDVQLVLGLLLYFALSPITRAALQDFGAAMGNSLVRFWAVEHLFGMVVGLVLAHLGRVRVRKAPEVRRHRKAAIFFGLALVAILASIPWPGMPNARPLFRW
jgi:hypothetical protein